MQMSLQIYALVSKDWYSVVVKPGLIRMAGVSVCMRAVAVRSFHDPRASVASEIAALIQRHSIKSKIIISHIRKANRGKVCLENTHPFSRELWGCSWVFAHNGQVTGIKKRPLTFYQPIGATDSEHAFCWMMGQIREKFPEKKTLRRYGKRFMHWQKTLISWVSSVFY